MRIIAGKFGGRTIQSPKTAKTHPMSEKMRGGLFNTLGDISGLAVLDAFAGSGALGLEALSRGASSVTFIENDRSAQKIIQKNCQTLGVEEYTKLISASVSAWLATNKGYNFDIIVADPPYDKIPLQILQKLVERVAAQGIIVYSLPPKVYVDLPKGRFETVLEKNYGDGNMVFIRILKD
jgi:16S rRNA (guanine966-N2)-methyltransferase